MNSKTKKEGILFFDLDQMKFETATAQSAYLNQRYGISTTVTDFVNNPRFGSIINKYLPPHLHVTDAEAYSDNRHFLESKEWHDAVIPVEGMVTIVPELEKKYQLRTVTNRLKSGLPVIEYLLNKYIPQCISGIHCAWNIVNGQFLHHSKRDYIESVQGKKIAFFDDTVHEIRQMQDILRSHLFDPHHYNDDATDINDRLHSWWDIGDLYL